MKLGVVIGSAWASRKVKALEGSRLCIVQPVSSEGKPVDFPLVAADPRGIGNPGDTVVYVTSTDAVEVFDDWFTPVNAGIVELVEEVV